jgi:predicted outer membrane repeat protein
MHLKFLRAAATVAVLGGTATLGLGSTPAALASPTTVDVPCGASATSDLVADMVTALTNNDTTLVLASDCTYWLDAPASTYSTGLPTVMNTLTIEGSNSTWIKRSYENDTPDFTIFAVGCADGDLILDNVNVKNGGGGEEDGGALDVTNGSATVNGGIFQDNNVSATDPGYGGAIFNDSTLTVDDGATFIGNSADFGGAIANEGSLTVEDATFTHNSAKEGGAIYSEDGATIDRSAFSQNDASDDAGGAIFNDDTMTVNGGSFSKNEASSAGGAIYNEDGLTVNGGNFSQNRAYEGGAFYNDDSLTVNHSTISNKNSAYEGGGFYNDDETLAISYSVVTYNLSSHGGGAIYNYDDGTVTLTGDLVNWNFIGNCEPVGSVTNCPN